MRAGRCVVAGRWATVALVLLGGLACAKKAELVPEPQRFALGCPDLEAGWPPDSSAPRVVLGGFADLRFAADTVAWAQPPEEEDEEGEEEEGFWESLANSIFQNILASLADPIPLIAVPDAISVLRWDVAAVLRRAGFGVVDAAQADSVPPGLPELDGDLRRVEAFHTAKRSYSGETLVASVAIELYLWGESPVPRWRRRFEAEVERKQRYRPERARVEEVMGGVWCDLLAQVEEAFRDREFSEAVSAEGSAGPAPPATAPRSLLPAPPPGG